MAGGELEVIVSAREREIGIERTGRGGVRPAPGGREPESFGELFGKLAQDSADLVRQEVNLAKLEMKETATAYARDGAKLAIGALLALVGALALTACLVLVIGNLLDGAYWAGALIVGAVFLILGAAVAYAGVSDMREQSLKPEQTMETIREDRRWARRELDDLKRELRA